MDSTNYAQEQTVVRRIRRLQLITIGWMLVEAAGALTAAWMAASAALLAFGGDSAIEVLSAAVVLWRFRSGGEHERREKRAATITAVLLLILAGFVIANSLIKLLKHNEPAASYLGITLLVAAAVFMPLLARAKRRLSAAVGSAALRADAAESSLCGYLSLIALVGLATNAIWRVPWADPAAALALAPLILWEARQALRGKACECC